MPLLETKGALSAQGYGWSTTPPTRVFIEDVFSNWLYTGTGSAQTITNGIDLAGRGGLVWMKGRSGATDHALYDTARGTTLDIASNLTAAQTTQATGLTSFLASGFSIGSLAKINTNTATYVSWTFREQPRFFDVVTYTGNGANRTIAHNLGSVPGCIMIKRLNAADGWSVYHRSIANTQYMVLNSTAAVASGATFWNSTTATSTNFSLGTSGSTNFSGGTYVAYIFAHNAGGFGATGTDNVISCGSFTTDGSGIASVTLSYEPQMVIVKRVDSSGAWYMEDNMRGMLVTGNGAQLYANTSGAEATQNIALPTSTGFTWNIGIASAAFIYIAIRRGPMRTPTTGTSVFGLSARTGTGANATVTGGQTDDAVLIKNRGSNLASLFSSRLTGLGYLATSNTTAESTADTTILQANPWDVMDGVKVGTTSTTTNASANTFINYLFRRAPGFFDVACYTGDNTGTKFHNLGVVPELIIQKPRSASGNWNVWRPSVPNRYLILNSSAAEDASGGLTATSTTFNQIIDLSGVTYVAYLFASCPGVSKVGSYTGTGATQVVNCGFAAGARFVLIKRTDSTGDWYVWDSARGIVAGNDPYLLLNSIAAEVTGTDWVDTDATGFELSNAVGNLANTNGGSYIFLAIA
jgi:hypothetical protein